MHVPVLSCVRASMCVRPCVRALPHHDASVCVRVRACACVSVLCARVRACACIVDEAGQSSNRWCGVCVGGGGGGGGGGGYPSQLLMLPGCESSMSVTHLAGVCMCVCGWCVWGSDPPRFGVDKTVVKKPVFQQYDSSVSTAAAILIPETSRLTL